MFENEMSPVGSFEEELDEALELKRHMQADGWSELNGNWWAMEISWATQLPKITK